MATIIKTFDGAASTAIESYDAKFEEQSSLGTIELDGSGACKCEGTYDASYYVYSDSQTGLDQSCAINATVNLVRAGANTTGPVCHGGSGVQCIMLWVRSEGGDILPCQIRTFTDNSEPDWLATISMNAIVGGAAQSIKYELICEDNGDGTVDISANINGTLYSDIVTNHTQSAGEPGIKSWIGDGLTISTIETFEATAAGSGSVTVSFSASTRKIEDKTGTLVTDSVNWSAYATTDLDTLVLEDEGAGETVTDGEASFELTGSTLVQGNDVLLIIDDADGNPLGAYPMVVD